MQLSAPPVSPGATPFRLTEDLVRRHQRGVWRYLRFLGADASLADDLTQEAFLAALRQPPRSGCDGTVGQWLRKTALRLFCNSGRQPRPGVPLDEAVIEAAWRRFVVRDDADDAHAALAACVELLPERQRRAVRLRYCPGGSRRAVAAGLELTEDGAKTLLRRARARLGRCVEAKIGRPWK